MRAIGRRTGVSEPLADPASLPTADERGRSRAVEGRAVSRPNQGGGRKGRRR